MGINTFSYQSPISQKGILVALLIFILLLIFQKAAYAQATPLSVTMTASNAILDSGQMETLTASWTGGSSPFTVDFFNVTSGTTAFELDSSSIGSWSASVNSYPIGILATGCVTYSGYIYCIGGGTSQYGASSSVYSAQILMDNSLGTWTLSTNSYPVNAETQTCVTASNNIYCIGGFDPGASNLVYYAPILSSNVIGSWQTATSYPTSFVFGIQTCVAYSNAIYCVANDANNGGDVYYAPINSGILGTWTATNSYPIGAIEQSCVTNSNNIYCIAGDIYNLGYGNLVYYAPILGSGGVGLWSASANSYPTDDVSQDCVVSSDIIYCIGGQNVTTRLNTVYHSTIFSSGVLGAWRVTPYPMGVTVPSCVTSADTIYCVGGYDGATPYVNTAYYAPIISATSPESYTFQANSLVPNSNFQYNVIVTDSTSATANSLTNTITVNPELAVPTLTESGASIRSGQTETLTAGGISGGTPPYTVNFFNVTGGRTEFTTVYQSWLSTNSYPSYVDAQSCVTNSNIIYCVGGYNPGDSTNSIYYAPIFDSGAVGSWSASSNTYPINTAQQSCVANSNTLYCVGGNGDVLTNKVYYSPILSSGELGAWSPANAYPISTYGSRCVTNSNIIYCIAGGLLSGTTTAVYYATIFNSGAISHWTASANTYPVGTRRQSCVTNSNTIYCIGGVDSFGSHLTNFYYAQIFSSGDIGSWSSSTPYPVDTEAHSCVTKLKHHLLHRWRYNCSLSATNNVYYAPILGPGEVGSWETATPYPTNIDFQNCVTSQNSIYCIAGANSVSIINAAYYVPVSALLNPNTANYTFTVNSPTTQDFRFNVIITDSATSQVTSNSITNIFTVIPPAPPPTAVLIQSNTFIGSGQPETLTAIISGGVPPYTVNFFNVTGGTTAWSMGYQQWLNTTAYPISTIYQSQSCVTYSNNIYCVGGHR